jgi:hypothetical protein
LDAIASQPSTGSRPFRSSEATIPFHLSLLSHLSFAIAILAAIASAYPAQYSGSFAFTGVTCRRADAAVRSLGTSRRLSPCVGNKLTESQMTFRSVLQALLLVVVSSDDEGKEVITLFTACPALVDIF